MQAKKQPPPKTTDITFQAVTTLQVLDDLKPGIYRTISIQKDPQEIISTPAFIPLDEGTPQKRLASLLELCVNLQKNVTSLTNKKLNSLMKNVYSASVDLIKSIRESSRAEIFKNETEKNNFTEYIQTFINTLNSKPDAFKNPHIIELWCQILIKSLSDISQFGCLLNNIPSIYTKTSKRFYSSQDISDIKNSEIDIVAKVMKILNSNINIVFVSSDKIAAGLSTNISKLIDYPIQTLCSRKTGVTTQTIIVQKSAISALAVILSYINDPTITLKLCEDIYIYQTEKKNLGSQNGENITNFIIDINNIIVESYNILKNKIDDRIDITNNIQIIFDELFMNLKIPTNASSSQSDDKITKYKEFVCSIIDKISKMANLNEYLNEISETLINYDYIKIPRWCYHLSNDIYKYKFALSSNIFDANFKKDISKQEILSATFDAMYGHDFKLQTITQLGDFFLTAIQEPNPYSIDESISISAMEDTCIKQTLSLNNYSTINQDGDNFSVCFNPEINYLIVNKTDMLYRESEIPWNITFSPLIREPIYAAVDFVSGEPSISVILSQQVNFIKQQEEINNKEILPFSLLDVTNETTLAKTREEIDKYTIYRELFSVMTLYDGAAPYGGKPFYILDNYEIVINFGRGGEGELKITTLDNKIPENELDEKWFKSRVQVINSDFLNDFRILLYNTDKVILLNKNFEPAFRLNQIFGTILNSANRKLSKSTAQSIFSKFNQLVGEIKSRVSLGKEGIARSRRTQTPSGHFSPEDYQEFSDNGIIDKLNEMIAGIYESELTNFNALLLQYIQIVTSAFKNKENPEYIKYIKMTKLLLRILEVTVKTIFTEDLSGLFVSLDYTNSSDLLKVTDNVIKDQLKIIHEGLERARKLVALTKSFGVFMSDKEKKRSIFTPIKITDTEPIQRAYFSDSQVAYNVGNTNNQGSSSSVSPLISSSLNKDLNSPISPNQDTQRDSEQNTPILKVTGPFGTNTSARLSELEQQINNLRDEIQQKDIMIKNLEQFSEEQTKIINDNGIIAPIRPVASSIFTADVGDKRKQQIGEEGYVPQGSPSPKKVATPQTTPREGNENSPGSNGGRRNKIIGTRKNKKNKKNTIRKN
jgi:hypothetical protein